MRSQRLRVNVHSLTHLSFNWFAVMSHNLQLVLHLTLLPLVVLSSVFDESIVLVGVRLLQGFSKASRCCDLLTSKA